MNIQLIAKVAYESRVGGGGAGAGAGKWCVLKGIGQPCPRARLESDSHSRTSRPADTICTMKIAAAFSTRLQTTIRLSIELIPQTSLPAD